MRAQKGIYMMKAFVIGLLVSLGMSSFALNKRTIRIKKGSHPTTVSKTKYKRSGGKTVTTKRTTKTTVTTKRVIQEPAFATRVSTTHSPSGLSSGSMGSVAMESSVTEIKSQKSGAITFDQDLKGLSASRAKHKENVAALKKLGTKR